MAKSSQATGWRHKDPNTRKEFERATLQQKSEKTITETGRGTTQPSGNSSSGSTGNGGSNNNQQQLTIAHDNRDVVRNMLKRFNIEDTGDVIWSITRDGTNGAILRAYTRSQNFLLAWGEVVCDNVPADYTDLPSATDWTTDNGFHNNYYYGLIEHGFNLPSEQVFLKEIRYKDGGVVTSPTFFVPLVVKPASDDPKNVMFVQAPAKSPMTFYYTILGFIN